MQVLSYIQTDKGSLILTDITEPYLDPLQTKAGAVEKTTSTPEFKSLESSIALYNKYVEKCQADKVPLGKPEEVPQDIKDKLKIKITAIADKQQKLVAMEKQHMAENPVYLLPGNSVFIADDLAEEITQARDALSGENIVVVELSESGSIEAWEVRPDILGKLYRLPDSTEWIMIQEPDEFFPDNAVFDDPGEGELERIELARIQTLDPDSRDAEKLAAVIVAKNVLMRETIAAGACDTPEQEKAALEAAEEDYKASLSYLDNRYR